MIDILTKIVAMFNSQPDINKMGFLSSFFRVTPDSFTDAEFAEIDVVRSGEEVAPVVRDLNTGAVTIVDDKFVNHEIPFPVYALRKPALVASLMKRRPGENAYVTEHMNWLGRLARVLVEGFTKMTRMIRYSVELQAAQVLQTGKIILTDEKGNPAYELDLKPKTSHFPMAAVDWGQPGADPYGDVAGVIEVVRDDGQVDVKHAIFDRLSWNNWIRDEFIQENMKQDGLGTGALAPALLGKGGVHMGHIFIGSYRVELWTYNGRYSDFGGSTVKKYLGDNTVILLPDIEDLDFRRLFGGIPTIRPNTDFDELFGASKIEVSGEYDFRPRVFWDENQEAYIGEIKSRPLLWPVSIDRFACLKTGA
ncbi:MAG: major capsid protein [Treponema sp.]|nr:major capsid protein [Treponema sp.]